MFNANIGLDAIPFDFDWYAYIHSLSGPWNGCTESCACTDSDWVKLYLGKKNGAHVMGCMLLLACCCNGTG